MTAGTATPGNDETRSRARTLAAAGMVAFVSFLPFLRGFLAGGVLYFRDLSRHFFPLRHYALDGLRRGELRYWNPLNHEGIALPFPPVGYPIELLQVLWPTDRGLSVLLALHIPFAAVAFLALARGLRVRWPGACAGALAYALGGFALSTVNLYIYTETLAWAPLAVLALLRAREGGRATALAALAVGVTLSTAGIELAAQALLLGLLIALWEHGRAAVRNVGAALLLGGALAAPVLLPMRALTAGTDRAAGFTPVVVLNQSVHPFTLLQVVVGNLYGDLGNLANQWWGANFFPNGFPYILSLYLGLPVLALGAVGVARGPLARRLAVVLVAATVVCLGRFFVLGPLVEALPAGLRMFRFPTKAFFLVHMIAALLAAFGLDHLLAGPASRWRRAAIGFSVPAALLLAAPLVPWMVPAGTLWFLGHFFPPGIPEAARPPLLTAMLSDAATGALLAAGAAILAALVAAGRLLPLRAAVLLTALVGGDLLRTGAGLNPMVAPEVLHVSPEVMDLVSRLPGRQRLYTCDPQYSPSYWRARFQRADHEVFTFATWMDTLAPNYNMPEGVATAYSEDLTSLVPSRVTPRPGQSCGNVAALIPELRRAAVSHVLSLDALESPDLLPVAVLPLRRVAPLVLNVYALRDPLPLAAVEGSAGRVSSLDLTAGSIAAEALANQPASLLVRSGYSPGWQAHVGSTRVPVAAAEGHLRVPVPAGASSVELRYVPPGLRAGLVCAGLALAMVAWLYRGSPRAGATVPPVSRSAS